MSDPHAPAAAESDAHADGHDDHGYAHVMPMKTLIAVFLALIFFTLLTVAQSATLDLLGWKSLELFAAMTIATIKAGLVAMFFMHLKYDKPLNVLLVTFSLVFVALFIGFLLMDSLTYQPERDAVRKTITP